MTWSYDDPALDPKDAVRFLIGDTDVRDQLVSDEEIEFLLLEYTTVHQAGVAACYRLASRFAREVTHSGDGLSYSGSDLHKHYIELAKELDAEGRRLRARGALPYVGGISWAEREKADADLDKIPTHFRSHMHDNPDAGGSAENELRPRQ